MSYVRVIINTLESLRDFPRKSHHSSVMCAFPHLCQDFLAYRLPLFSLTFKVMFSQRPFI